MTVASTVGYGEFVPKTMLSRGFNAFAIVLGVVFFTVETGELYRLKQLEESGRGKFIPKKPDKVSVCAQHQWQQVCSTSMVRVTPQCMRLISTSEHT